MVTQEWFLKSRAARDRICDYEQRRNSPAYQRGRERTQFRRKPSPTPMAAQTDLEDYAGVSQDPKRASFADVTRAYRACLVAACAVMRLDVTLVPARPAQRGCIASPQERLLTLARQIALYVLNCELDYRQYQCAAAAGLKRAGALYVIRQVEDMRDDPFVDRMIEAIATKVKQREAA